MEWKKHDAELLHIGACNLHVLHNAFKAGSHLFLRVDWWFRIDFVLPERMLHTGEWRMSAWTYGRGSDNHLQGKKTSRLLLMK